MKPTYILAILGMLSLMGCASTPRDRRSHEEVLEYRKGQLAEIDVSDRPPFEQQRIEDLKGQLAEIDISDGIDAFEARIICDNYFMRFCRISCGGPGRLKEEPDRWIIPVHLGYGAEYRGDIRIDKHTGTVSWNKRPTVVNPKAIWKTPRFRRNTNSN